MIISLTWPTIKCETPPWNSGCAFCFTRKILIIANNTASSTYLSVHGSAYT